MKFLMALIRRLGLLGKKLEMVLRMLEKMVHARDHMYIEKKTQKKTLVVTIK